MKLHLHQTHHTVADFQDIFSYIEERFANGKQDPGLHVFPELFLTGYPLQDLCLQHPFIIGYTQLLERINRWSAVQFRPTRTKAPTLLLMGGLDYDLDEEGIPVHIRNVIYALSPGKTLSPIYTKRLLPNYDIFDEKKYFTPGEANKVLEWEGKRLALLVCEDMWPSSTHPIDPVHELQLQLQNAKGKKKSVDLVINLSASPFNLNKEKNRTDRGMEISRLLGAPFAYVNRVGGEDGILFDGQSFVASADKIVHTGAAFLPEVISIPFPEGIPAKKKGQGVPSPDSIRQIPNTWENLFGPQLEFRKANLPILRPWSDLECASALRALSFGLQEYARKCHFQKFLVAFSGGIDSALCLWITSLSLRPGQTLEALYLPSRHSSTLSTELAFAFCKNLRVPLHSFPIKFIHSVCERQFADTFPEKFQGMALENIQSRLRGTLLYARSNQTGSMVINTSNKSELAVGYSTLYGDSVGAISLLGDLYKTEVFRLTQFLAQKYPGILPREIITRPPTAELRENQKDEDSLPPYERLDPILEGLLSYRIGLPELIKFGFEENEIKKVIHLYQNSEYKRFQFGPIIKIKPKSFGFGYRVPITKNSAYYLKT